MSVGICSAGQTLYLSPELAGVRAAVVQVEKEYGNFAHHQQPRQAEAHHEQVVGLRFQNGKSAELHNSDSFETSL